MTNCECKKCGLRGYSKNVQTRNVFANFDGRPLLLEQYEMLMRVKTIDGVDYWGTSSRDWTKEDAPYRSLAEFLIGYLKTPEAKPEDLRILMCDHDWVQDKGTATV